MDAALARIEGFVDAGGRHLVATVNPGWVMRANDDREFAGVLESAALCIADGSGSVWGARRQGCDLAAPVTGVDLIPLLAALCARRGFGLYLLGAAPGVADELARQLQEHNPGLQVAAYAGSADPSADDETVARVEAVRPRVLMVAFGARKQEIWIDSVGDRLNGVGVAIGVGGSFDYLTGRVPRAPMWMRRAGMEWVFRLARQPWRIRRMAVLPAYALKVLRSQ